MCFYTVSDPGLILTSCSGLFLVYVATRPPPRFHVLVLNIRIMQNSSGSRAHSLRRYVCCAALCCAVLCCAVLCCAVLCCAVLCCAVLCCAVFCSYFYLFIEIQSFSSWQLPFWTNSHKLARISLICLHHITLYFSP